MQDRVLRGLERLPPFSPVLQKLLSQLAQDDVSFKSIATLVEKDAVLAGHVLRVVNSAAGGFRSRVNSVVHGISLLGVVKLRNILLGLSVSQMWTGIKTPASWSAARFNLHSVAVATFADLIAQEFPVIYPEGAFIAGLLHDLGRLLIVAAFRDEFEEECERQRLGLSGSTWLDWETNLLGCTHAEISALGLKNWRLPAPVQEAVQLHHVASAEIPPGSAYWPLEQVLAVADRQVHSLGFSYLPLVGTEAALPPDEFEQSAAWIALRQRFLEEVEPLQAFYGGLGTAKGAKG